jgi:hypothetical protein
VSHINETQVAHADRNGHNSASGRRLAQDVEETARHLVTRNPSITGAELARQLGVPERTGGRVLKRIKRAGMT